MKAFRAIATTVAQEQIHGLGHAPSASGIDTILKTHGSYSRG